MKNNLKTNKGITLLALVITIIVLLILAGISIAMLNGQNGVLNRARDAKLSNICGRFSEEVRLAELGIKTSIKSNSYTKAGYIATAVDNNNVAKNTRQFKNIKLAFTLGAIAAREQCECGCHYETECFSDCMKTEHCILKRIFNAVKRYSFDDSY